MAEGPRVSASNVFKIAGSYAITPSDPVEVGQEWTRLSVSRELGPEIEAVRIVVQREHQRHGGDIWIDDVQLEQGDKATPYVLDTWTREARADALGRCVAHASSQSWSHRRKARW